MTQPMGAPEPQTPSAPADSHGAIDLAAHAAQGSPVGVPSEGQAPVGDATQREDVVSVRLDVPLITQADESTFELVMSTSRAVPVVIVLWAQASLESRSTVTMMEDVARRFAGRFQLVEIDAAASPAIAQAFQIQALPTVVAVIGGRPVPLFQGAAAAEQVVPVIEDLLAAAAQMGVTGGVKVSEADTAAPIPEEHLPALAAEEAGDLLGAIAAWEKVIEHHPKDEAAKAAVARVRLLARQQGLSDEAGAAGEAGAEDAAAQADALFADGQHAQAFEVLLAAIASTAGEERDAARLRLLDLFRIAGATDEVRAARQKLATLLMI